ncbi:MAG: RecX family transcriptional regulator [Crocinitomicaceae bacterium]|nr:RecX family transcriptional regulator [Crocinitomicaceae bacterium]
MKKVRIGKEQAIQRIRHYCAYQERAQQEVRDKLYELGMTMDEVEEIMSDLIAENFLNEERFATQFAGGHFRIKGWGKVKIQHALQQKRVSSYNIKIGLKAIDEDAYIKTLKQLATKKWNSLKGERGLSRMAKTYAFLHQRGFEPILYQPIVQALYKA